MGREGGIIFTAREIGNATCHADRFRQHPASANANDGEADEEHGEPEGEGEREREEGWRRREGDASPPHPLSRGIAMLSRGLASARSRAAQ